jgi:drug/metabolite transporter (DMT)-like permease
MSWTGRQLLELLCFPVAMAAGQVLFKRAASQITPGAGGSWLIEVARLPTMWVAVTLYAGATLFWVRILTTVPLSRAYPFAALAFVLVPAAGYLFFHEPITIRYALGTALIVIGVAVAAGTAS